MIREFWKSYYEHADVTRTGNANGAKAGACAAYDPVDGNLAVADDRP